MEADYDYVDMRCSRVYGSLSLGLILYLSVFPLGKAQLNCVRVRIRARIRVRIRVRIEEFGFEFEFELRERSPGS